MEKEMMRRKLGTAPSATHADFIHTTLPPEAVSGASWESYFDTQSFHELRGAKFRVLMGGPEDGGPTKVTFLMLHGAGHSAMSFAMVSRYLKKQSRVVAFDMRGHGATTCGDETDMSAETLTEDAIGIAAAFVTTPVIVVGHSMGGAIAVRASVTGRIRELVGIAVLDVVEGTAISALPSMTSILNGMPPSFPDLNHAVTWNMASGAGTRNAESAAASVPAQLRHVGGSFVWRTNLKATERHWRGWFEGLSEMFLRVPAAKLLLLAGTDRLDKPLTIGQMQGKFQLQLLPNCGHLIHEDDPEGTANILVTFARRFAQKPNLKLFSQKH